MRVSETMPGVTKSVRIDLPLWERITAAGFGGRGEFSEFLRSAITTYLDNLEGGASPSAETPMPRPPSPRDLKRDVNPSQSSASKADSKAS